MDEPRAIEFVVSQRLRRWGQRSCPTSPDPETARLSLLMVRVVGGGEGRHETLSLKKLTCFFCDGDRRDALGVTDNPVRER